MGMELSGDWSSDYRQLLRGHLELWGLPVQPEGEQNIKDIVPAKCLWVVIESSWRQGHRLLRIRLAKRWAVMQ